MQLNVPWEKVFGFASRKGYGDMALLKASHRNALLSCSDVEIVLAYNAELRGLRTTTLLRGREIQAQPA
jgi:RNA-directed DNA polymerase